MKNDNIKLQLNSSIEKLEQTTTAIRAEIDKSILSESILQAARSEMLSNNMESKNAGLLPSGKKLSDSIINLFGGIAGASLFTAGLIDKKTGLTISGACLFVLSALSEVLGSFGVINGHNGDSDKQSHTKSGNPIYDFSMINVKVYNEATQKVKGITKKWNDMVEGNHYNLNNQILDSNLSEEEKSELLARVASEIPFNISLTDFLNNLGRLEDEKNLEGIKNLCDDLTDTLRRELDNCYEKQLEIYNNALKVL